MTPQQQKLYTDLLQVCVEQNEMIRQCNLTFKNVVLLLEKEHKEFEEKVRSLSASMMRIKEESVEAIKPS